MNIYVPVTDQLDNVLANFHLSIAAVSIESSFKNQNQICQQAQPTLDQISAGLDTNVFPVDSTNFAQKLLDFRYDCALVIRHAWMLSLFFND